MFCGVQSKYDTMTSFVHRFFLAPLVKEIPKTYPKKFLIDMTQFKVCVLSRKYRKKYKILKNIFPLQTQVLKIIKKGFKYDNNLSPM